MQQPLVFIVLLCVRVLVVAGFARACVWVCVCGLQAYVSHMLYASICEHACVCLHVCLQPVKPVYSYFKIRVDVRDH